MRLRSSDFISGLIVFLLGLIFYLDTLKIKPAKMGLSPADFPRLITICLMICGTSLAIKGLFSKAKSQPVLKMSIMKKIVALSIVFFAYILFLDELGFLVLTPFLIFASVYIFGGRKIIWNILISMTSTVVIYYIFAHVFKVPLPSFSL